MNRIVITLVLALAGSAHAQQNLIPNWNFADSTPLKDWRVDFPDQDWYKKNVTYVKQTTMEGKRCAVIELPAGIAGNEGGKIETALVPAEPGATYHVEVECLLPNFSAKLHAEAYAVDPRADLVRQDQESKGARLTIFRIPPREGRPALVAIYRAQLPDPTKGTKWVKVERDFTLPMENRIGGTAAKPAWLTVKAYTYEGTQSAGKAYFTNFKLSKLSGPGLQPAPKTNPSALQPKT